MSVEAREQLPSAFVWAVVIASLSLFVIGAWVASGGENARLVHGLVEWSAVCVLLLTAFLASLYLRIRANYLVVTIAASALAAGYLDALHSLGALRLIPFASEPEQFLPLTWALSRTAKALVLLAGVSILLLDRGPRRRLPLGWLGAGGALLVVVLSMAFVLGGPARAGGRPPIRRSRRAPLGASVGRSVFLRTEPCCYRFS